MNPDDVLIAADRILRRSEKLLDEAVGLSPHRKAHAPVSAQATTSNTKLAPQREVDVNGRTRNEPIGPYASSTYVSIEATCPRTCPYRGNGCYAQAGMAVRRLDREAVRRGWSGIATIEAEVAKIDKLFVRGVPQDGARGGRDLRLHVSGDAFSTTGAELLAGAADRWLSRGGGSVWTFTHLWRRIPRASWGPISVLASVETRIEAREAIELGYAPALTVQEHDGPHAISLGDGARAVPCVAQTRGITCVECRLCLDNLVPERGITLALHGHMINRARRALSEAQ